MGTDGAEQRVDQSRSSRSGLARERGRVFDRSRGRVSSGRMGFRARGARGTRAGMTSPTLALPQEGQNTEGLLKAVHPSITGEPLWSSTFLL